MVSIGEFISSLGSNELHGDDFVADAIDSNKPLRTLSNEQISIIADRVKGAFLRSDIWIDGQASGVIYEAGKKFVDAARLITNSQRSGYTTTRKPTDE